MRTDLQQTYLAYGEIQTALSLKKLQTLFADSLIRESSHYQDCQYLLLTEGNDSRLICEKTDVDILLSGDAETPAQLLGVCQSTSATLAMHQLRHRIELYNDREMYAYFHFDWPQESVSSNENKVNDI